MQSHCVASSTSTVSLYKCCKENNCHPFSQTERYYYGMNLSFVRVHVVCVCQGFIFIFCFIYPLIFYKACVPLNSGWRTTV
jgi:hypothetical protein